MQKRRLLKIVSWVVLGIIGIFLFIVFLYSQSNNLYESNYWEIIGFTNGHSYENVLSIYGEPSEILYENDVIAVKYDAISFLFFSEDKTIFEGDIFRSVRITDPKFRFGPEKIGVNSTREEVQIAYKDVVKNIDVDCGYHDGSIGIDFFLNEDDVVNQILIGMWP